MSSGGSRTNASADASAKPPSKDPPGPSTPSGETTGVLKNLPADTVKVEPKQTPSKDNNVAVTKEPTASANKGETNQPPEQANKGEVRNIPPKDKVAVKKEPPAEGNQGATKQPAAEANKGVTKESAAEANKSASKQPAAEANKGETKESAAEANKSASKQPAAEANKGETKESAAEANKSASKQPAVEANKGVTKESAAEANKDVAKESTTEGNKDAAKESANKGVTKEHAAEANESTSKEPATDAKKDATKAPAAEASKDKAEGEKGAGPKKPFSETTAAVAYYIDEFGERKRFCGAARKRFKWLVSKGFTEEEARGLAHQGMQQLQPIWALKCNFADDDYVTPPPKKTLKRSSEDLPMDEDPPTPPTPPPPPKKKKKMLRKDRTFNQPPEVMKEPLGGIRVGVIAAGYPETLLSAEQLKLLRFTVLEQMVPEKQGAFKPKFLGTSAKPGFIIFHCEDKATVLWLKTVLHRLNSVVEADLRALEHYQIPRKLAIVGYFPNKRRESINKIFEIIKEYNDGLNVDAWVLHKLITIKGITQAIIAVDHQSAAKLVKDNFKIQFKKRELELKPDVKFLKNVEVTVYIPKDPKEGTSRPWNKWWNPKLPRPPKYEGPVGTDSPGLLGTRPKGMPQAGGPSWNAGPMGPNPGPSHENPMFGNGPPHQNPMFGNGPPQQNPMFGSGPPQQNPMFGNGPPQQNPMFGNGPPQQNPMFGHGPPQQNPMFGHGPPQQNPMFGNGPPNQNPMFGNGPQNQNPMPGNGPPNQNPMFGNGPPNQNPMGGNGPPVQTPLWGSGTPAPFLAICPPGPPQGPMPSHPGPQNMPQGPGPRFGPEMMEPGAQMNRDGANRPPPSGPQREPGFKRGNQPNFMPANQEEMPQNRNPAHGSDRPSWDRRRGERPSGPPSDERPPRAASRERGFAGEAARPPWAAEGSQGAGRPPRDASAEGDRARWGAPRGSASEDDAPRFARSRDRFSNRGPEPAAGRRPRSRSRHSPDRPRFEADGRRWPGAQDSYPGEPPRGRNLDYPDNRSATEADRRPRDPSRDSYSNRESLTEAERPGPAYGRPREYLDRGPGVEADMQHPRGPPQGDYSNRGPANDGPPRGASPERFPNRASPPDVIRRPWDRPQESYQGLEVLRQPRDASPVRYPIRGQAVEDERPPWAATRERFSNRNEANEPERIPRDASRERFSNRGSATEDDRWGMPRDRSLNRGDGGDGSASEVSRPQWGTSRGSPPRGRPRERAPVPGHAREDDVPPWARQGNVVNEPGRPEWAGNFSNRDAPPEGNRRPRSRSREEYRNREDNRKDNRPPWAEPEDTFGRRGGRETEYREPQWGSSGERFSNRGPDGSDGAFGPSRENFPNRGSATEADERPPWAQSRDSVPNRAPTVELVSYPLPKRAANINREVDRQQWGTSRDGYANRGTAVDERPRDKSRERFSQREDELPQGWGPSRDSYSSRGSANEGGRPPWAASRDSFSTREGGNRPTTPEDSYRGSNREAGRSSSREFPAKADGRDRGARGGGFSNRGVGGESRAAASRDRFSDRSRRSRSRERYPNRGSLPEPPSAAAGPPWAGRSPQRPDQAAREFRESFSGPDDVSSRRRPAGEWGAPRNPRGSPEVRGSRRDAPAREQQGWSGRPTPSGPHRGSVGGGRFYW